MFHPMKTKNAKAIDESREKREKEGLIRKEFWVKPSWVVKIKKFLETLK